jgi:signal-transduction protein with cAMP-binding, CBS, and nucleotidyltransferase domain
MGETRAESSTGMEMLTIATIGELTYRPHAKVAADAPLGRVVEEMKTRGRGCALVEEDGHLVGIFTERDLLNRVDHHDAAWRDLAVRTVMTPNPLVGRPTDSLAEVVRVLEQGRRRHLPVIDDQGVVLGLISIRDVMMYIANRFPEELMNLPPDPTHER